MNWYKQAQWDMYGQPLEFQEQTNNLMYNQTVSDKNRSWYDNEGEYKKGPVKDFYEKMRGMTGEIKWMSPDEYIDICVKGIYYTDKTISENYSYEKFRESVIRGRRSSIVEDSKNKSLLDSYKDRWITGEQPPMGYITYEGGEFIGQEGMHRAIMAKDLGIIQIPVLIINRNENELV